MSILNLKVLCHYITSILLLSAGIGINFIFRGIVIYNKIKTSYPFKEIGKDSNIKWDVDRELNNGIIGYIV